MKRRSGILLPVASLPSEYGIGAFDECAYHFVDFLASSGQSYWQILPLGPTGYGNSPYQSFSTYAGNPYFIDLKQLIKEGLLNKEECDISDFGSDEKVIDYEKIYFSRFPLLKKAFERSTVENDEKFRSFCADNEYWLPDYSLFMALKDYYQGKSFVEWEDDIKLRTPDALKKWQELLYHECLFYRFLQYKFYEQWGKLKSYANGKGVEIIGDVPIYVAFDSADSWANPELFQFTDEKVPVAVAGCPPDGFSPTGQLWGNPVYDWDFNIQTGFAWWIQRIKHCFGLYDMVRIDHFRGFDEYYTVPFGEKTAVNGCWKKGPGLSIFQAFHEKLGELNIIAEDLGFLTPSVKKLLSDTGYPGMKVLHFAFGSGEDNDYLPHKYHENCVVYTGTHDNDTTIGWYETASEQERYLIQQYLNLHNQNPEEICSDFICLAMRSVADLCVIPMQDYLMEGKEGRINKPSTVGTNWCWRMQKDVDSRELAEKIYVMTKTFGR